MVQNQRSRGRLAQAGLLWSISLVCLVGCGPSRPAMVAPPAAHVAAYDVVLRHGVIYDGSGSAAFVGDLAIRGDSIAAIGDLSGERGKVELDLKGLAVAPGFVNMMSWANESLIQDGRSQSDIRQGVTLEVLGEGNSMGPLSETMKRDLLARQGDIRYPVEWTTLGEYLEYLVKKGVSPNVASFLGAATARKYVVGYENRKPTAEELEAMQELVRQAMEEGAIGVASALIYPPGSFADTQELIVLARVAGEYGGLYASHIRGEGRHLLAAIDELLTIAREAKVRAEIYHFKASGRANWHLLDQAIQKVEGARAQGLQITADVYTYPAGSTGLNASMPPWVQEGGFEASLKRLKDPALRRRIAREMGQEGKDWENLYLGAGSPENILLVGFKQEALKPLTGKTLAEVAKMRGTSPEETAMDLLVEDRSRVTVVYFSQSEANLRKKIALPWVSFCSDAESLAPEGVFLSSSTHPRAYGSFSRLLAKYVREEKIISLQEAIRKLTSLPAGVLGIEKRGSLQAGYFADVVVFDPKTVQDHATFANPHQHATGVVHVFVNGVQVLRDGEHTGATPGRVVRGPGWKRQRRSGALGSSQGVAPAPPTAQAPVLLGEVSRRRLETELPEWAAAARSSSVDARAAAGLRRVPAAAEVVVYVGTWCGDSRREVPRLWKALDLAAGELPFSVRYIAVDRTKKAPAELLGGVNLRYVPTVVVKRQGREVGRIVESSPSGIERDLLDLLNGERQGLISGRPDLAP